MNLVNIVRPNTKIRIIIFQSGEINELRIFFTSMWVKYKQGYVFKSNDPIHIPLGIAFYPSIFLFKKIYKILILGFSRCLHRLARFTSGLYVCIVRFSHVLALFLVSFFLKNNYVLELGFWTVDCFVFLSKKLLIEWRCFCALSNCCIFDMQSHMPCEISDWFVCLLFSFLTLYVLLQCCLIFCSVFEHSFPDFFASIPHFYIFWFLYVCLGITVDHLLAFRTFHLPCFTSLRAPSFFNSLR